MSKRDEVYLSESNTDMYRSAIMSQCGKYRYALERVWNNNRWKSKGLVNWIMLNPSTADGREDDPTIRRCMSFAKDWGYGGIIVTNLFAFRATNPRDLGKDMKAIGVDNDLYLSSIAYNSEIVICAWGAWAPAQDRAAQVRQELGSNHDLHVLALTKHGAPVHPLYQPKNLRPIPWPATE